MFNFHKSFGGGVIYLKKKTVHLSNRHIASSAGIGILSFKSHVEFFVCLFGYIYQGVFLLDKFWRVLSNFPWFVWANAFLVFSCTFESYWLSEFLLSTWKICVHWKKMDKKIETKENSKICLVPLPPQSTGLVVTFSI